MLKIIRPSGIYISLFFIKKNKEYYIYYYSLLSLMDLLTKINMIITAFKGLLLFYMIL